jgi:hypothetical protein
MSIDEAARATRRYVADWFRDEHSGAVFTEDARTLVSVHNSFAEAQAACDRLNLAAVVKLRDRVVPMLMVSAMRDDGGPGEAGYRYDALLADLQETPDA